MKIELLSRNFIQTTTVVTLSSNTAGASFLFDRRPLRQYKTVDFNNDLTTASMSFAFDETATVERIILQNINWKDFTVFTNGSTASTISLTSTVGTTTSDWTGNSATNLYLYFDAVNATSVSFDILSTQSANQEKAAGQIVIADQLYRFERNPSTRQYTPTNKPREILHTMSDGGTVLFHIRNKINHRIRLTHFDEWETLRDIYIDNKTIYFSPFPTGAGWDGNAWEVNWSGGFDPLRYSENQFSTGKNIDVDFRETAS